MSSGLLVRVFKPDIVFFDIEQPSNMSVYNLNHDYAIAVNILNLNNNYIYIYYICNRM